MTSLNDNFVVAAFTALVLASAYAYVQVVKRLDKMEKRWRRLVNVLYEINRLLYPEKTSELQDLMRTLGENGERP